MYRRYGWYILAELAGRKAAAFGFERATGDWRAVVNDPE
jgi:hypothetical protein